MIVSALLGALLLTDVTQVCGRGHTNMSGAAPQMARPLENDAPSGRSLVLTGIIAYTDPKQGFAIIGGSVQNTYLVRPGEQLPDGSLIREIYAERVVLEYEGRLETVGMYKRGEPAGDAYVQTPPLPQRMGWGKADPKGVTAGDTIPSQSPRPTDEPPGEDNGSRSYDPQTSDALQKRAQPEVPLPSAQDPVDELGDDRRLRSESRRK